MNVSMNGYLSSAGMERRYLWHTQDGSSPWALAACRVCAWSRVQRLDRRIPERYAAQMPRKYFDDGVLNDSTKPLIEDMHATFTT